MSGLVESAAQAAGTTEHHAKYFAWELTRRRAASEEDRLAQSLFDASVDLNACSKTSARPRRSSGASDRTSSPLKMRSKPGVTR